MVPMKRPRDADDDEVIAVESASSNLRLNGAQNKKFRLSSLAVNQDASKSRREPSPSSSASEDELPDAEEEDTAAPPATQYDALRDNNFEHLRNPDADDIAATQRFESRRRGRIGQNIAAENAIIEEVTCINFMCHTKLHVQFSPLINFVVGLNGSGKSAVLTAITLCLGGKASATNRGASLKTLIRGGQESAILKVKLKNEGSDAYQPDLYGDSIIVERHFSKTGSSGFRLKSSSGRTISTKKGDVDDIIEYFNLQVDNPMNVLTQDAAKSFIQNSTPAQKYKFFVEGVQLQQLDNDYRMVSDLCDQIEEHLGEAKKDIKGLQKQYEAAAERARIVSQHQGMKDAAKKLRSQLVWIQIAESEARLGRREEAIVAVREDISRAEGNVQVKSEALQQMDSSLEAAKRSFQQLEDERVPLEAEEEAAREAHTLATKNVTTAHTEQRHIGTSIKAADKKVNEINKSIKEEIQRIEDANGGAHTRKFDEIEKAKVAVQAAKDDLDRSEADGPRIAEQRRAAENEAKDHTKPLSAKREEVLKCASRLHDLQNNQQNVMKGFDPKMPDVINDIRNARGFKEAPVGPIGKHIRLLNPVWSDLLETFFGNTLNGFIVTSKSDQGRLVDILKRRQVDKFCPIYIASHHPVDTTGHEPDLRYATILRVLEIDQDIVRRQLIIQQNIEQTMLIARKDDAYHTLFTDKPINTKACYALNEFDRGYGVKLTRTGTRGRNVEGMKYTRVGRALRMITDSQTQIRNQLQIQGNLQSELRDHESHYVHLQNVVKKFVDAVNEHGRSQGRLRLALQRSEERVEQLESELAAISVEDGRLESMKAELAEAEAGKKICQESYITANQERDQYNVVATERKAELDAVKIRVADHAAKITKAKAKVANTESARSIVLYEKNQAMDELDDHQRRLFKANEARDAQAEALAGEIPQAEEVCRRVALPEGETHDSLAAKYKKMQDSLKKKAQKLGATDEEIYTAQEDALGKFQTATTNYDDVEDLLFMLKASFKKRMEQFWRFQRYISATSRTAFTYLLGNRAFRGKLLIDHKNKKLDVHVEPDETTKSGKGRQTKTLSGGEKSFSSICLLLALWEAMGAPLRCLDEYDVFMDDVNRDVSTKMIIEAARHSAGRQYIMITPKALGSGAAAGEDVKIHKLDDPRDKGQKRIDEMMESG